MAERVGVGNISQGNSSGLEVQELEGQFRELVGSQFAGSLELSGILMLSVMSYALLKSDADPEVQGVVLIPTVFFLASEGLLPFGDGIIYGGILAIAAVFAFGLIRYI